MNNHFKILFLLFLFFSTINCLDTIPIEIKIQLEQNQNFIPFKGKRTLIFSTNFLDKDLNIFDSSDIESQTTFMTQIRDENNIYHKTICRLSKPENDFIKLKCNL